MRGQYVSPFFQSSRVSLSGCTPRCPLFSALTVSHFWGPLQTKSSPQTSKRLLLNSSSVTGFGFPVAQEANFCQNASGRAYLRRRLLLIVNTTATMTTTGSAFLSHSSRDASVARRLCAMIEAKGVRCWIAPRDIDPGAAYADEIVRAIQSCDTMVLLLTPAATESGEVLNELELAHKWRKIIVPLMIGKPHANGPLDYYIARLNWIEVESVSKIMDDVAWRIVEFITSRKALSDVSTPPSPTGVLASEQRILPSRPDRMVFLCHSSGDKEQVRRLHSKLKASGIRPWLDEEDLVPGTRWEPAIQKAVKESDIVLVCLSKSSVTKEGFVQKEIRIALDVADRKPEDTIYIIPARLEECTLPDRLSHWQSVDLFRENGFHKLVNSIRSKPLPG